MTRWIHSDHKRIYGRESEESQFLHHDFCWNSFFVDELSVKGPAESLMMTRRCSWTTYHASTVCEMTLSFHVSTPPQTWSWPPSCSLVGRFRESKPQIFGFVIDSLKNPTETKAWSEENPWPGGCAHQIGWWAYCSLALKMSSCTVVRDQPTCAQVMLVNVRSPGESGEASCISWCLWVQHLIWLTKTNTVSIIYKGFYIAISTGAEFLSWTVPLAVGILEVAFLMESFHF